MAGEGSGSGAFNSDGSLSREVAEVVNGILKDQESLGGDLSKLGEEEVQAARAYREEMESAAGEYRETCETALGEYKNRCKEAHREYMKGLDDRDLRRDDLMTRVAQCSKREMAEGDEVPGGRMKKRRESEEFRSPADVPAGGDARMAEPVDCLLYTSPSPRD